MGRSEFSESTYAFAVTRELVGGVLGVPVAAPSIPSLQAEGASGGGYDVKIPLNPVPLFLQFKVPDVLKRSSYLRPPGFPIPYYRIHLRTSAPNQHKLLLELEAQGNVVFYTAPRFHQACELDNHFSNETVALNSIYIRPDDVGFLDSGKHHIAYCGQPWVWVHSEPQRIERRHSTDQTFEQLRKRVAEAKYQEPKSFLEELSRKLVDTINQLLVDTKEEQYDYATSGYDPEVDEAYSRIPDKPFIPLEHRTRTFGELNQIALTYLGTQLYVLGSKFSI